MGPTVIIGGRTSRAEIEKSFQNIAPLFFCVFKYKFSAGVGNTDPIVKSKKILCSRQCWQHRANQKAALPAPRWRHTLMWRPRGADVAVRGQFLGIFLGEVCF